MRALPKKDPPSTFKDLDKSHQHTPVTGCSPVKLGKEG